jgi:membrane protease YdiL (CAAX protease family)
MDNKKIFIYLAIIYLVSWTIQLFAIFGTSGISSNEAELFLLLTMLTPTVITIIYLVKNKSLRSKILWKPRINVFATVLLGVLIPTIIAFASVIVCSAFGFGNSEWFTFSSESVTISGGPWLLGLGTNNWVHTIVNIALTALAFSLMSGIPAAAEEFTWRGFLQGVLIDKLEITKGVVVLGLIWSFWHLPALLAGYNHPDYPILGSFLLQPIQEIAISFFLAWLTITSKSFIPAAIAHGAGNSIQEGVINNIQLQSPIIYKDITVLSITVIVGLIFWFILTKKKKMTYA